METKPEDIKDYEDKVFQQYNSDGAFETLLGSGFMIGGLLLSGQFSPPIGGILPILLFLLAKAWKRHITYPRLGYAELTKIRHRQKRRLVGHLLILLFFTLLLAVGINNIQQGNLFGDFLRGNARLLFGSAILVILVLIAIARGRRAPILFVAAALYAFLLVFALFTNTRAILALAGTGAVLIVFGIYKLVRFIRANPRISGDTAHGSI